MNIPGKRFRRKLRRAIRSFRNLRNLFSLSFRRLSGCIRKYPDFIIAGVQKGGTTSLYNQLIQHPDIDRASKKEVHFFDVNYGKGRRWYQGHFPVKTRRNKGRITGEASPYYLFHPHALHRIKEMLPEVKIIVLLREPLARGISHYAMEKNAGREEAENFRDTIERESVLIRVEHARMVENPEYNSYTHAHKSYISRGLYSEQIHRLLHLFDREQIYIVKSEDYFRTPVAVLGKIHEFLEVRHLQPADLCPKNTGIYPASIEAEEGSLASLATLFSRDKKQLVALLGEDFSY